MYICLMASLGSDTLNPWLIMIKVLFWLESFFYPMKILNYAALRCEMGWKPNIQDRISFAFFNFWSWDRRTMSQRYMSLGLSRQTCSGTCQEIDNRQNPICVMEGFNMRSSG